MIVTVLLSAAVLLDWKPSIGETHLYHAEVRFDSGGDIVTFNLDLENKVVGIAKDGSYRLSSRTTHAIVKSSEGKKEPPDEAPTTRRYNPRGLPQDVKGAEQDPFSNLLDHLTEYESPGHPVEVGDSWINASSAERLRVTYRLADVSHSGSGNYARVSYAASDGVDPFAASGNLTIALADRHLVHLDVVIPHFRPDTAGDEARVEIVLQEKA